MLGHIADWLLFLMRRIDTDLPKERDELLSEASLV